MKQLSVLILCFICFFRFTAAGTSWNEPWMDSVVSKASSFVLARIVENKEDEGVRLFVHRTLEGKELKDTITITSFYLFDLCSRSGDHGADFRFGPADSCYFFIQQDERGTYKVATPTTGFAYVQNGMASATFRHSYHKAQIPLADYELTMRAIFRHYHGTAYNPAPLLAYVSQQLQKKPAGFAKDEMPVFFRQHAAMETIYHLRLKSELSSLLPFLYQKDNFHNQISAARAMITVPGGATQAALVQAIADTANNGFVKVMCIHTLQQMHPTAQKTALQALLRTASDEEVDFGGDIMDPRVCTSLPSVKAALEDLLKGL